MKTKLTTLTLIALLSAAGTTTALAHEDYSEGASLHWLSHLAQASQPTANANSPLGYAVTGQVGRVVTIDSGTKYLNVTRGETVQINVAGKSVTWVFDTLGTPSFTLDKIIPGAGNVTVYVDRNPSEQGG